MNVDLAPFNPELKSQTEHTEEKTVVTKTESFEYKGHEFLIKTSDPYGLCHVENAKGGVLGEALKGRFTAPYEAQRHIMAYVNGKIMEEEKMKETTAFSRPTDEEAIRQNIEEAQAQEVGENTSISPTSSHTSEVTS